MDIVAVSSKYQVVIPKKVRQSLNVQLGQKMRVIEYGHQIIILATARNYHATLWTQDSDFENIDDVQFIHIKK